MTANRRWKRRSISRALRLGRAADVPNLIFVTDQSRVADPVSVCRQLPAGSIVICRDYDHADRTGLAKRLRKETHACTQFLLVAGDIRLARLVGADGVHLPEYQLERMPNIGGFGLVSAACHSRRALLRAQMLNVDFALVSPVFKTNSHPGAKTIGVHRLARLANSVKVPLVALGGVKPETASQLRGLGLLGIAAIGALAGL
ncbi:MAG: thiamine phosphate synthase [Kordiimonadales bacterium]|nr:MAG: thiamine phosphate synthase [Kordiimonadales bacterium]